MLAACPEVRWRRPGFPFTKHRDCITPRLGFWRGKALHRGAQGIKRALGRWELVLNGVRSAARLSSFGLRPGWPPAPGEKFPALLVSLICGRTARLLSPPALQERLAARR